MATSQAEQKREQRRQALRNLGLPDSLTWDKMTSEERTAFHGESLRLHHQRRKRNGHTPDPVEHFTETIDQALAKKRQKNREKQARYRDDLRIRFDDGEELSPSQLRLIGEKANPPDETEQKHGKTLQEREQTDNKEPDQAGYSRFHDLVGKLVIGFLLVMLLWLVLKTAYRLYFAGSPA